MKRLIAVSMLAFFLHGCTTLTKQTTISTSSYESGSTYKMKHLSFSCDFSARDTGEDIVFNNKMWISNGYYHGNVTYRDLWSSEDGIVWQQELSDTPYDAYSEMVVYNDKIWAVKGSVWNSSDGLTWTQVSESTPFGSLSYAETVVFKDKIFQLGNNDDVWSSEDGITWELVANQAPYGDRKSASIVVHDNKLWLMGGYKEEANTPPEAGYEDYTSFNDVWVSEDGTDWELVTENASWPERQWAIVKVFDNKMWLIGGYSNKEAVNLNDTWYSEDGVTWTQFSSGLMYTPRHEPTVIPFDDSLYIFAGNEWPVLNDAWRIDRL